MVGGAVAHPAATTELNMKVSLHGHRSSSVKQALVFFASENETTVSRCAAPTASLSWPVGPDRLALRHGSGQTSGFFCSQTESGLC
jgi:hypothetical protein